MNPKEAAAALGLTFKDLDLFVEAITHRSYLNEHRDHTGNHNERLEFLGDAVLELAATRFLYVKYPAKPEGELTAYRAALVNTVSLAQLASTLGVSDMLLLSKGEARDTGRARDVILANALEAIVGALYLDQGYDAAQAFLARNLFPKIDDVVEKRAWQDAKSRFQEAAQEKKGITPSYKTVSETGPDHDKHFTVAVQVGSDEIAQGEGKSKQDAEQSAAQNALVATGW